MTRIKKYFALPFFLLARPIEGYKRIKYEKQGKWSHVLLFTALMCISYTFRKQYKGFLAPGMTHPLTVNFIFDITVILIAYLLFCVANWSITTLVEGEGKFLDIVMNIGYSFFPMILAFIPATILSRYLTVEEAGFFGMITGVSSAWFLMLAFISILVVHNFTFTKTLVTIILTAVAVFIIAFMTGLLSALLQQVVNFIENVYTEIIYRI